MDQTTLILIAVAVAAVLVVLFLLLRAGSRPPAGLEGDGVGDAFAAAAKDTLGPIVGIDLHPDLPPAEGEPDALTRIKGLGPKASAQLNALGISRFDQLAAMTPDQSAWIDDQMGPFKGRLERDRWVEQADHLAKGDTAGFEAKFGKLGG